MKKAHRKVVVLGSLVGIMTLTSAILLALAPAPLSPDAASSLFAIENPASLDVIFNTRVPLSPGRWRYIYIHHSKSQQGNASTLVRDHEGLTDHFVIGNGQGCVDGELQIGQRWNQQLSAAPPAGATDIDRTCISICLIGDFDRTLPTPTQMRRLAQLVETLQARLHLPADNVLIVDEPASMAGSGRYFPVTAFRSQLRP